MEWRHLKQMGDLGVVIPVPFSPRDEDSMHRAMEGSDIVINLIGKVRLLFVLLKMTTCCLKL